jgi:hypothetical protein
VHGAGAAGPDAAAVLGADQAHGVAQGPQQRGVRFDIDSLGFAVDVQGVFTHASARFPMSNCQKLIPTS